LLDSAAQRPLCSDSDAQWALRQRRACQRQAGDPEWGEAVHAEIVLGAGFTVRAEELIAHARTRLGRYKTPKSVVFVETLPTFAVGKVLRPQVREKYRQGAKLQVS